jgi:hypothetical protein
LPDPVRLETMCAPDALDRTWDDVRFAAAAVRHAFALAARIKKKLEARQGVRTAPIAMFEVGRFRPDGIATFEALHRHSTVSEAMLYAFDLLEKPTRYVR